MLARLKGPGQEQDSTETESRADLLLARRWDWPSVADLPDTERPGTVTP